MNPRRGVIFLLLLSLDSLVGSCAQEIKVEPHPLNSLLESETVLHVPRTQPTGLLVLLPAGNVHSFDERSGYTPSTVPGRMATNCVVTLITSPRPGRGAGVGLYAADAVLEELDGLISEVTSRFKIPSGRLAIGGFSAGGIGAVRYAEFCAKGSGKFTKRVAVFAVDSPLDYERWFLAADIHLKRLALAGKDLAEDRSVVDELKKEFGGSPTEVGAVYRRQSALSVLVPDGGNASWLKDTPIRLYVEPDIKWRLEHWDRDVYSANITDTTALINVLRLLGNRDAELITTSGKGFRPDGSRNPHSWSIVDESELITWLKQFLLPSQ